MVVRTNVLLSPAPLSRITRVNGPAVNQTGHRTVTDEGSQSTARSGGADERAVASDPRSCWPAAGTDGRNDGEAGGAVCVPALALGVSAGLRARRVRRGAREPAVGAGEALRAGVLRFA